MSPAEDSKPGTSILTTSELAEMRKLLLLRRALVTRSQEVQLSELSDPSAKAHLADLEEMASDSSEVDSLCEIMDIHGATVAQIDTALEKIEEGSFGLCEHCDEPIARARLEALPFASLCISCQRRRELYPHEFD